MKILSVDCRDGSGQIAEMSFEQAALRSVEMQAWDIDTELWMDRMRHSDAVLSRAQEDMIDALDAESFGRLSPVVRQRHADKKALRALRP